MNLMLFDEVFESVRLERADPRAQHLRKVLRAKIGTLVFLGFVNGARARAKVVAVEADGAFELEVVGTEPAPAPLPITLLIGLPRPHTAKRILFEAASLGVAGIHFLEAERSEPSYAQSSLWQTDEWRDRIRLGTEQAFGTHLPQVAMHADLQSAISALHGADVHVALDNYETKGALGAVLPDAGASDGVPEFPLHRERRPAMHGRSFGPCSARWIVRGKSCQRRAGRRSIRWVPLSPVRVFARPRIPGFDL